MREESFGQNLIEGFTFERIRDTVENITIEVARNESAVIDS